MTGSDLARGVTESLMAGAVIILGIGVLLDEGVRLILHHVSMHVIFH